MTFFADFMDGTGMEGHLSNGRCGGRCWTCRGLRARANSYAAYRGRLQDAARAHLFKGT